MNARLEKILDRFYRGVGWLELRLRRLWETNADRARDEAGIERGPR